MEEGERTDFGRAGRVRDLILTIDLTRHLHRLMQRVRRSFSSTDVPRAARMWVRMKYCLFMIVIVREERIQTSDYATLVKETRTQTGTRDRAIYEGAAGH